LVIVDDEQRFGVGHKEWFKQTRHEVDVLALSATPIPRTLHMALSGLRDMSAITTPPETRQSVRTYVAEYNQELVREAILRELDRGGQVFFIHNRIKDIHAWAAALQKLVPQARIAVGHGRMEEKTLASVMSDFAEGKLDVLVCTTIVEAGLDWPNVNTLIVHRPEMLGLAQLYQLRGRVGRGRHRAYAYFLTPPDRVLTASAEERIHALLAHQELGSGFRIAMKDLEIRGAGNLLGAQQSGHARAIGFDLYTRLLEEAVEGAKSRNLIDLAGGAAPEEKAPSVQPVEPRLDLPIQAYIPEDYIVDVPSRLGAYQLFASASMEKISALEEELRDRFGPPPESVNNLLYVVRLRALAGQARVRSLSQDGGVVVLQFEDSIGGARLALQRALGGSAHVGASQVRVALRGGWQEALVWTLEQIIEFQECLLSQIARVAEQLDPQ
jgi:transcription-repair coupling factor (superfamily II helicase)